MDALSEALKSVHMTGAIFFEAVCTAPWGVAVPPMEQAAHVLAPGTERLVGYHLVAEGRAMISLDGGEAVPVSAGDLVVFPLGDPHTITNGAPPSLLDAASIGGFLTGELANLRIGGGGEATRFVCGYFGCERHAARLFLSGLPRVIRINLRTDGAGRWIENTIRHLLDEAASGGPGRTALLSKMAEALFIEMLRRHAKQLPAEQTGWLAGARDPVVGAVLFLLHRAPRRRLTIAELAAQAGASRSVIAERFARFLGEPPLVYIGRWRLQLAARELKTSHKAIAQVASDAGYESVAAFTRAFKREFSLPPGEYRRKAAIGAPRSPASPPPPGTRSLERAGARAGRRSSRRETAPRR